MAKISFKGIDAYAKALDALGRDLKREVIGKAIYDAANIVADAIRSNIETIPVNNGYVPKGSTTRGIPQVAKDGLRDSLGITPMLADRDGVYNVKIGFDGYNGQVTKAWPKGAPNQLVARSVERGTSWLEATPFVKRAVSSSKKAAEAAMQKAVEDGINKSMKE